MTVKVTASMVGAAVLVGAAAPAAVQSAPHRVYERVTPAAKGGSPIRSVFRARADGSAVTYESYATLAGTPNAIFASPYVSFRGESGWQTLPLAPSVTTPVPYSLLGPKLQGTSEDMRTAWVGSAAALTDDDVNGLADVATVVAGGSSSWLTPTPTLPDASTVTATVTGASDDGDDVFVSTAKQLLPGVPGGTGHVYRHGPTGYELVSVLPNGTPAAGAQLGAGRTGSGGAFGDPNAVSRDGQTVFFSTTTAPAQLYVRKGGVTKLVSADTNGNPGTAASTFQAATPDGSRVVFSSTSQLTTGAPVGGGLYVYDLATNHLRLALAGVISGVLGMSDDGERIYVASTTQVPTTDGVSPPPGTVGPTADGQPGTGPYIYLVTDVGVRAVTQVNSNEQIAWSRGEGGNQVGISADGRRLVFVSRARLEALRSGIRQQVYRYDAVDNQIRCLSCPPDGGTLVNVPNNTPTNVTDGSVVSTAGRNDARVITDDGALTVFETVLALVPEDTNGLYDVYGYDDETGVHLISSATATREARIGALGADGRDVFFRTDASLVDDDTDGGLTDIYNARVDGGFPPAPEGPCSATNCDRPDVPIITGDPGPLGSLGVFSDAPPAKAPAQPAPLAVKLTRPSASAQRSWARSGKTTVRLTVNGAAKVRLTAKARVGGKQVVVGRGSGSRTNAGAINTTVKLSSAARKQLRRSGSLRVTLTATADGAKRAATATLKLVQVKR